MSKSPIFAQRGSNVSRELVRVQWQEWAGGRVHVISLLTLMSNPSPFSHMLACWSFKTYGICVLVGDALVCVLVVLRLLACEFLLLLYSLWAQTLETEWLDVCISEELGWQLESRANPTPTELSAESCANPASTDEMFRVAFDPLSPSEDANLTLILQPADALEAADHARVMLEGRE
eukprot:2604181-Amphidinium_carterae.1